MSMLARVLAVVLVSAVSRDALAQAPSPRLADARIVMRTQFGDAMLVLYPDVAPKTVAQFLALARAGVYDGTHVVRIEPGFVAQVSSAQDRGKPLERAQEALIHRLPLETAPDVLHVRGVLSLAHEDGDPNSGETSFSVLLGPAPHLDGKYTIFGRVEVGMAVIDEMLKAPRDETRPVARLPIRMDVYDQLSQVQIDLHVRPIDPQTAALPKRTQPLPSLPAALGLGAIVIVSGLGFALEGRLQRRMLVSLLLINVLVAGFVMVVLLTPVVRGTWAAGVLFAALIGMFKLMGKFESAA